MIRTSVTILMMVIVFAIWFSAPLVMQRSIMEYLIRAQDFIRHPEAYSVKEQLMMFITSIGVLIFTGPIGFWEAVRRR